MMFDPMLTLLPISWLPETARTGGPSESRIFLALPVMQGPQLCVGIDPGCSGSDAGRKVAAVLAWLRPETVIRLYSI